MASINPPPVSEKSKKWLGMYKEKGRILGDIILHAGELEGWEVLNEGGKCTISAWEK